MPQLVPVVITDLQGDTHTFNPNGISNGVATLVQSTGVPIGDKRLSISSTRTQTGKLKSAIKMVVPVVQDVVSGGISRPTVVRTAYADITFTHDETSSTVERDHTWQMLAAILASSSLIHDTVTGPSTLY